MDDEAVKRLVNRVRQTAFDLRAYLGNGHFETIYRRGLANRLRKQKLLVDEEKELKVYDEDGFELGIYKPDLFIESWLVVELKVAKGIADEHVAQLMGYLASTRMEHGMVINFGAEKFQARKFISNRKGGLVSLEETRLF